MPSENLEETLQRLAAGRGRIDVIYDPREGWCVTDDLDAVMPSMGSQAPEYRVTTYKDWFCNSLGDAIAMLSNLRPHRPAKPRGSA